MINSASNDGTVGKALGVLDKVAGFERPVRLKELLIDSPHTKTTLYRLLKTLTNQGMLSYDSERQAYSIGIRLVRLAHEAWRQSSLAPIARPFIDNLAAEIGLTVHLAQLDSGQVLYIDKRNAIDPIEMFSQAGKVGPGYCTGVGKAMIAFLSDKERKLAIDRQAFHAYTKNTLTTPEALEEELEIINRRGFSFDNEEHEQGIICVASPILTQNGVVLGGLSITSSLLRTSLGGLEKHVPILRKTAREIAIETESWRFPDHSQLNIKDGGNKNVRCES